jgi:Flp pilus assembly protein TadB
MTRPGEFEERMADALSPVEPPLGGQVVRQAQIIQTLTEATSRMKSAPSWVEDADPKRRRQAATAVIVSRAVVFVVAYGFAVAVMIAVLVRVLEWLS